MALTVKSNTNSYYLPEELWKQVASYFTIREGVDMLKTCKLFKNIAETSFNVTRDNQEWIREASRNGHLAVVEKLLTRADVDPSVQNNVAVQQASINGHQAVVLELLKNKKVNPSEAQTEQILETAYASNDQTHPLKIAQELLKKYQNTEKASWVFRRVLYFSSEEGYVELTEELLRNDLLGDNKVIKTDEDISTLMRLAVQNGHTEVVEKLSKHKDAGKSSFCKAYASIWGFHPKGWIFRKIVAIPAAIFSGIIKTIYHLAKAILLGLPKMCMGDRNFFINQMHYFSNDLNESLGWLLTLFNDRKGSAFVAESLYLSGGLGS